ncbi:hypothetical protein GYMLUDRAFT_983300, partial [Collybiopsis luxurians FD-317 M1]
GEAYVVEASNSDYLRMKSLQRLAEKDYRMDIINGNLVQYIMTEYRRAGESLGETSTDYAESQYQHKKSSTSKLADDFIGEFPLLYYAGIALVKPASMSLSTIATLQQSSTLLRWSFWDIFSQVEMLRKYISRVQQLFDLEKSIQRIKDGDLPYPSKTESMKGMTFELRLSCTSRNVVFSYPGSKAEIKALNDVSFRIEPGELVVIVGENGSGKSTFVKLLTRLFDVNEGTVLADGEDIRRYKLADFRQHIATLTQDHILFPLSIEENIGLGCPSAVTDMDLIMRAAKMGGAIELLKKLKNGMKTVLDPYSFQYGVNIEDTKGSKLAEALNNLPKKVEISVLFSARTFMRLNSNKIKFVAVDEPSSALDPAGELELFDNLREARKGKTMIFVTHRFGHLTKHADRILCMKEGRIVESGSHTELMALNGEYRKMYEVQANAFQEQLR